MWFAIFGWSAMRLDGIGGDGGALTQKVIEEQQVPLAMFEFFSSFPAMTLVQGIAVVVVALFFATSSDSASLVVDMLCSGDEDSGPVRQRLFWGVSEGMLAASLIVLGGDKALAALQQAITVIGLPIFILACIMMFSLAKGLKQESRAVYALQFKEMQPRAGLADEAKPPPEEPAGASAPSPSRTGRPARTPSRPGCRGRRRPAPAARPAR
ncbi:BCCT family transporter, partial [Spirillospora sp. NPDC052242]